MRLGTIDAFLDRLATARRVLLTTHIRPDGDALGSVAVLATALRQRGVNTTQLLLSHMPTKYRFVFEQAGLDWYDLERKEGGAPWTGLGPDSDYDTLVVSDTGTFSQLTGIEAAVAAFEQAGRTVLVLDHHRTQEPWGTFRLVDSAASSAAELAWRTVRRWEARPTPAMAQAAYVGIVSDTGWFQFSNTTADTMRLAAELMEAGVDTDGVYQRLFLSERESRIRLQARAMASLRLYAGGRLAVLRLSRTDFEETGAGVPDTENVINLPLAIGSVEMSVLAVEPPDGAAPAPANQPLIRVSCRSKGKVDVARFAEQFGGGGHARASGLKLTGELDAVVARVVTAAEQALGG